MGNRFLGNVITAADTYGVFTPAAPPPPAITYETLTFTGITAGVTVTGNGTDTVSIFKTSGSVGWGSQAYSSTGFTAPCTLEFKKQAASSDNGLSYAMISLNTDPTTDASYSSLDFAAYPYQTSQYWIYDNGSGYSFAAWDATKTFYLVFGTDGTVKHYNGSTLLYTGTGTAGVTRYIDTSLYAIDATYSGFSNIRLIKKTWNGTAYV